ncbi:MAG: alkaline phosphatase D family protein [Planctomycetota bacterium]|nr:alkaline phosphatase D family protein [Planctomycetota bacterium]MDA1211284.1 alkaline phosphatase D family protein [Planctomycetota bacterium]
MKRTTSIGCFLLFGISLTSSLLDAAELTHGPMVGHVTSTTTKVWARFSEPGEYSLNVREIDSRQPTVDVTESTNDERDLTVTWSVNGLLPGRQYRYEIRSGDSILSSSDAQTLTTPLEVESEKKVKLAFGSCAWDVSFPEQPVWTSIDRSGADAMILLGDTPYIDSTQLPVLRQRYRDFWGVKELKELMRHTPIYAVWDDHDYGSNDALGAIGGRENSRQVFLEYHANPEYGVDDEGIFCKFRRGPVEVFLLDTRWFANTEASPFDSERKTLIGSKQWKWLKQSLTESTAPLKVLACGMIWNEAARPGKLDYWMAYPYEREGLFAFLNQQQISGVVLIGGDIHRSRHLIHPTRDRVGYDLHEFVTSPLAENVADYNNVPSPYLIYDAELLHSHLLLTVDATVEPVQWHAEFYSQSEKKYGVTYSTEELQGSR